MTRHQPSAPVVWGVLVAVVGALVFPAHVVAGAPRSALRAAAAPPPGARVEVVPAGDGTLIRLRRGEATVGAAGVQIVPLRLLDSNRPAQLSVTQMSSSPWLETGSQSRPATGADEDQPDAPVQIVRQGRMRGVPIAVVQIAPVYTQSGSLRVVDVLQVFVPGAAPLDLQAADVLAGQPRIDGTLPEVNPLANTAAIKVIVSQAGIQRVTGAQLAGAGLDLPTSDPSRIHLRFNGQEVPLEERLAASGRMAEADELRFFAPSVGDRWNITDTYWLSVEAAPGLRMTTRNAVTTAGSAVSQAVEQGSWRDNKLYDSATPGLDGDHWFAIRYLSGPGLSPMTATATLSASMPVVAGQAVLRVRGSALTSILHTLSISAGGAPVIATWSGWGDWQVVVTVSVPAQQQVVQLALLPGASADSVFLGGMDWQVPIALDFGSRGGRFSAPVPGQQLRLSGTPTGRVLYDVTDPQHPQVVTITDGADAYFQQGAAPGQYVLAGPGTLVSPLVARHEPVDATTPRNADVIYIAPALFQPGIASLVALRQTEGHAVTVISPQVIYDTWSYGQVSPDAIRSFLRYAVSTWRPAPLYVTLVGDGTSDPHDYTGKGPKNVNIVPPYLAMVDPWIKESACDSCYVQLDGDSPLSDPFPDLSIGRLPAKNTGDLAILVDKILAYVAVPRAEWQMRVGFLADNYRSADGSPDAGGDFSVMADTSVALQPSGVDVQRVYYDPYLPTASQGPWREPSALAAYTRTISLLNSGAAFVNYYGHGHQYQMAATDSFINPFDGSQASYLFYWYDPDRLTNTDRLFVMLQMTCLTTAFQTPAFSGETIDERLMLVPHKGAIAVWGSSGFVIAYGQQFLQRGFYLGLWNTTHRSPAIGDLTYAGYYELLTRGSCCHEAARTFVLLGDPATQVRMYYIRKIFAPLAIR